MKVNTCKQSAKMTLMKKRFRLNLKILWLFVAILVIVTLIFFVKEEHTVIAKTHFHAFRRKVVQTFRENILGDPGSWHPDNPTFTCYKKKENDKTLPELSSRKIEAGKSIFFLDTTCGSKYVDKILLSSRQACSIESAAMAHPNNDIHVVFTAPADVKDTGKFEDKVITTLLKYNNIKMSYLDLSTAFEDTPVQSLYKNGIVQQQYSLVEFLSSVLRFVLLYKYGGVSLETDVIVLQPLLDLEENYAGLEQDNMISSSVINFGADGDGHKWAEYVLNMMDQDFKEEYYKTNETLYRLLCHLCRTTNITDMTKDECQGFKLHEKNVFCPILPKKGQNADLVSSSKTVHMFSADVPIARIELGEQYEIMAKKYCPQIYQELSRGGVLLYNTTTTTTTTTTSATTTTTPTPTTTTVGSTTRKIVVPNPSPFKCYRNKDNVPTLPNIESRNIKAGKSIVFLETTCVSRNLKRIYLNPRQACSIESAAIKNPNFDIHIMFTSPATFVNSTEFNDRIINALWGYKNIHFSWINIDTYFTGTPVEELYKSGLMEMSRCPANHLSDILKFLTMWKYGVIYMDLDVINLDTFEDMEPNFSGFEWRWSVATGVMQFEKEGKGHEWVEMYLRDVNKNFDPQTWAGNANGVLSRVVQKICNTTNGAEMTKERCNGFMMYHPEVFYPLDPWHPEYFFNETFIREGLAVLRNAKTLHMWNGMTNGRLVKKGEKSAFEIMFMQHCPKLYAEVPNDLKFK